MIGQLKDEAPASGPGTSSGRGINSLLDNKDFTPNTPKSQELEYNPQAVKVATLYQDLNDEGKRDAQYLLNNLDKVPDETPDAWQPLTMTDFYQARQAVIYVLEGIIKEKSLGMIYGAPGDMKSMLMQDLAVNVAMGKPWLKVAPWQTGGHPIPTAQGPVIWLDQDMGADLIHERFRALGKQHEAPEGLPLKVYSFPNPPFNASDAASVAMFAARASGARLIVIDNLGTVSGGIEENSSGMIQVLYNLRWLSEATGAALMVIHHQRKSNGMTGRAGDALRGHSSIEAALDLALQVEREPYSDQVTIKSTKTRTREVPPFTAHFTYTHNQAKELETAQFYSIEPEDLLSNYAIDREIKAALEYGPLVQNDLWQAVKAALPDVGRPRILDQIRKLEAANKLKMTPGAKNSKAYSLPVCSSLQQFAGASSKQDR